MPPAADFTRTFLNWENVISSRTRKMAKRSSKGSLSWHTLLPWRSTRESQRLEVPVEHVGLLSYLTYFWMDGFMWRAFRSGVDRAKLWTCPAVDTAEQNAERYNKLWTIEKPCWRLIKFNNQSLRPRNDIYFEGHHWIFPKFKTYVSLICKSSVGWIR